nr:immunogloblin joining (J) chain [earthwarms, Peptide Partial, 104 aa] [earthworms]
EDIVQRYIRINVPLKNRGNISDPTSPIRNQFVTHLSNSFRRCDPYEDEVVTATQTNICTPDQGVPQYCRDYDRNKCYTVLVPLGTTGETKMVQNALTPDNCYPD